MMALPRSAWRFALRIQTRTIPRHRREGPALETVAGRPIVVLPGVFNPVLLRTGKLFAEALPTLNLPSRGSVLDLCCGSGVAGIVAAATASRVVAVDLNPVAVRCAKANAVLNDVEIDVRHGDLFSPVSGEQFDVILCNPPYYAGVPRNTADLAWRSTDVADRFAAGLADHLTDTGCAFVILSTDGSAGFVEAFNHHGLFSRVAWERDLGNEVLSIYQVMP